LRSHYQPERVALVCAAAERERAHIFLFSLCCVAGDVGVVDADALLYELFGDAYCIDWSYGGQV
jgi:hypothetical protein